MNRLTPWFDDEDLDYWRRYPDGNEEIEESLESYSLVYDGWNAASPHFMEDVVTSNEWNAEYYPYL